MAQHALAQVAGAGSTGQTTGQAGAPGQDDAGAFVSQEVVVTGTSIRGIKAVGSAATNIGREQLALSGRSTPVDILRELPQVQSLGFDDTPHVAQGATAGNFSRGSTVNLRGLGNSATLLLIDGRRVSTSGNFGAYTEANQLPAAAIERIEVIADGASAIYGSDAVAGVVNYITRKRFEGVELQARGTTSKHWDQWGLSAVTGKAWDSGRVVVVYDHDERDEMFYGDSALLRQDLSRFGGPDNRIRTNSATAGLIGSIVVPRASNNPTLPGAGAFDYYGVRANAGGALSTADLLFNQPSLLDSADYTSYLPKSVRNQASIRLEQDLTDWLSFSGLAFYNRRDGKLHAFPQTIDTTRYTLPSTSPYYVPGIPGVAPGTPLNVVFSLARDIGGPGLTKVFDEQKQANTALTARLGDWVAEGAASWSRNRNCAICMPAGSGNIDAVALQAALNAGTFNPFGPSATSPSVLAAITPSAYDHNRSSLDQYTLRFDGPLLSLPTGQVKAAFGAEYFTLSQQREAIGNKASTDVPFAHASRNITASYAELFVPLVGQAFTLPLVQQLNLDLAVRTQRYSDVGETTNPKVGLDWVVTDGLTLRGAWGTSFRAPDLVDNHPAFFSNVRLRPLTNRAGDPTIGLTNTATSQTNVVNVLGKNPDLKPERATNYSFGVDVEPRALPGFRASVTYYNVVYKDQILSLAGYQPTFLANAANRAIYAPYIVAAPQPVSCVNGVRASYNPAYLKALASAPAGTVDESNFCSARAITYSVSTNASTSKQAGIDLQVSYRFAVGDNRFIVAGGGSKILTARTTLVPGAGVIEAKDVVNYPVSLRGRGSVTWNRGPVTLSASANYVGAYTNNLPVTINGVTQPTQRVPAWTTFDLSAAVDLDAQGGWARGLSMSLNIRNVTDKDPPVVISLNGTAVDAQAANPFGAIASFQVTKRF